MTKMNIKSKEVFPSLSFIFYFFVLHSNLFQMLFLSLFLSGPSYTITSSFSSTSLSPVFLPRPLLPRRSLCQTSWLMKLLFLFSKYTRD